MDVYLTDPNKILLQETYDHGQLAEAILDHYYVTLHYLAYSILGDADEADDAVQEGLINALDKIDRYRPDSNMKAWLSSIVINQCKDKIRRCKTRQKLKNGLKWIFQSNRARKSLEDSKIGEEANSALWAIVNQLGEKHRLPIILRYVHNLTVREIAQILQIREGTVHSRLHYACRHLGKHLTIHNQEELLRELLNE